MRIGALASATGTTTKILRFYEQAGLLGEPPRTSGGYRDYPAQARVGFIRSAQAAGLSLTPATGTAINAAPALMRRMAGVRGEGVVPYLVGVGLQGGEDVEVLVHDGVGDGVQDGDRSMGGALGVGLQAAADADERLGGGLAGDDDEVSAREGHDLVMD
ncbi:MerR family DNA-binding transcriptional regulator [Streptomyces hyaluromycini]|uniref:MerR family DNA-binding transcriptional regulator n=1 Tax=Streptomyces hyaluromycini TaxID=1377993 RepID=UPI000B5CFEB6